MKKLGYTDERQLLGYFGERMQQILAKYGKKVEAWEDVVEAQTIARRARAGEALAREIFEAEGRMLGSAIARAINLLNPGRVVIGGGVSLAFDLFAPTLKASVDEEIYNSANPDCEILPTPLGYMAGLYGAAAIAVCRTEHLYE